MQNHFDERERLHAERAALMADELELQAYGQRLETELRELRERMCQTDEWLPGVAWALAAQREAAWYPSLKAESGDGTASVRSCNH